MAEDNARPEPPGASSREAATAPSIPDHTLLRRIGKGSYGQIWLARSTLGAWRAVKVVYSHTFSDPRPYEREFSGIKRFEPVSREHEGFIDILQVGRNDQAGFFYYVMELADPADAGCRIPDAASASSSSENHQQPSIINQPPANIRPDTYTPLTLAHLLREHGHLPTEEVLRISSALAEGLHYLHSRGLVHRDLKPSNIIFVGGQPKLADVGLVAELGDPKSLVGTEGFTPPEGPGTPQADIYSLGKVIYEVLTGRDRQEFPELPTRLGGDGDEVRFLELNEVVLRACAKEPRDRYQSASEMLADLKFLQQGKSLRHVRRQRRTRRLLFASAAILLASSLIGSRFFGHKWQRATDYPLSGYQYDVVENNRCIYVLGGTTKGVRFNNSFFATVGSYGSLGAWTATTPLPQNDQAAGVAVYSGWMYVALQTGGVYRARIEGDGSLGSWIAEPPIATNTSYRLALRAYEGFLYAFGRYNFGHYNVVRTASIAADGTLGAWNTTTMPQARMHQAVHFYKEFVYLVGGITSDDVILKSVYSAAVNADGTLGAWRQEADLPTTLWQHGTVRIDNRIYLFGGLTGYSSGAVTAIYRGTINPDGTLTGWEVVDEMPSSYVLAPGTVFEPYSGQVFLIGGHSGSGFSTQVWRKSFVTK